MKKRFIKKLTREMQTINAGDVRKIPIDTRYDEFLPIIIELNVMAEKIQKLNKMRSEFFANASHELNTPLTSIGGYAELMENGLITDLDKIKECGAKIKREAGRMSILVNDMLSLSSLENPETEVKLEAVNIRALVDNIAETLKPAAKEAQVKISVLCFVEEMTTNENLLKSILVNLMQNAVKYNKAGGSVELTVRKAKKKIEFTVADTGVGIAKEDHERIFERFYRADKSRSEKTGGTGLGLAIVKHAAAKLNGEVRFVSEPNHGSEFTVSFHDR